MTETRKCRRCGNVKPLTTEHFRYSNKARGLFLRKCRTCYNEERRKPQASKPGAHQQFALSNTPRQQHTDYTEPPDEVISQLRDDLRKAWQSNTNLTAALLRGVEARQDLRRRVAELEHQVKIESERLA